MSSKYNESSEEVLNDNTIWSWFRWAAATIKEKVISDPISIQQIKSISRNGKMSVKVLDNFLKKIYNEMTNSKVIIYKTIEVNIVKGKYMNKIRIYDSQYMEDIMYIPMTINIEMGSKWMLFKIDRNEKLIEIYNPEKGKHEYEEEAKKVIMVVLQEMEHPEMWKVNKCISVCVAERETDYGIFVAAWAKSVIKTGKVENCIKNGQVMILRSEIGKVLTIVNCDKYTGKKKGEEDLLEVVEHRRKEETALPNNILKKQTEFLKIATTIKNDNQNGRHLVLNKGMNKGDILGYYYGKLIRQEAWDDTNEYNLQLDHMDEQGGAFIDGTPADPIDEYRLSLINGDYTETMTMHNCIIDKYGRIIMTRKTGKGKQLLMHYGLDKNGQTCYNWDKLDETLVKIVISKTMELTSIISEKELLQIKESVMSKK